MARFVYTVDRTHEETTMLACHDSDTLQGELLERGNFRMPAAGANSEKCLLLSKRLHRNHFLSHKIRIEINDKLQSELNETITDNVAILVILFRINERVLLKVDCDLHCPLGDERLQSVGNLTVRLQAQ